MKKLFLLISLMGTVQLNAIKPLAVNQHPHMHLVDINAQQLDGASKFGSALALMLMALAQYIKSYYGPDKPCTNEQPFNEQSN